MATNWVMERDIESLIPHPSSSHPLSTSAPLHLSISASLRLCAFAFLPIPHSPLPMPEPPSVHPDVLCMVDKRQRSPWFHLLDLVYPRRCLSCDVDLYDRATDYLCFECWADVEPIGPRKCPRCSAAMGPHAEGGECLACKGQTLHFDGAAAFGLYRSALRNLVHRYKYGRCSFLCEPLGRLLAQTIEAEPFAPDLEVIVPVPLHWRRRQVRGFNQSELLAKQLSRHLLTPADARVLKRTRLTTPQAFLGSSQRRRNLAGAFAVRKPRSVDGKCVLLVDDVMTTCSTTVECAKTLKAAGAAKVYVATIAR